jgi:hypothetical protein
MTSEKVMAYMLEQQEKSRGTTMTEQEERVAPTKKLSFGLWYEVPEEVTACWGARWIFPNDQLHDRQSIYGHDTDLGKKLVAWLNGGALGKARETASKMAKSRELTRSGNQTIVLFEDKTGIIKGNPNASYGYVYVCAYLKEEVQ